MLHTKSFYQCFPKYLYLILSYNARVRLDHDSGCGESSMKRQPPDLRNPLTEDSEQPNHGYTFQSYSKCADLLSTLTVDLMVERRTQVWKKKTRSAGSVSNHDPDRSEDAFLSTEIPNIAQFS